jgi:hypothetical protein
VVFEECTSDYQTGISISELDGGCAQGVFGRAGFLHFPGLLTCVQPPPPCISSEEWLHHQEMKIMSKVTPDPPDSDSAADIMSTPRNPCSFFIVNPELDTETLLAYACESLA